MGLLTTTCVWCQRERPIWKTRYKYGIGPFCSDSELCREEANVGESM